VKDEKGEVGRGACRKLFEMPHLGGGANFSKGQGRGVRCKVCSIRALYFQNLIKNICNK
jgi:hypothetical protein